MQARRIAILCQCVDRGAPVCRVVPHVVPVKHTLVHETAQALSLCATDTMRYMGWLSLAKCCQPGCMCLIRAPCLGSICCVPYKAVPSTNESRSRDLRWCKGLHNRERHRRRSGFHTTSPTHEPNAVQVSSNVACTHASCTALTTLTLLATAKYVACVVLGTAITCHLGLPNTKQQTAKQLPDSTSRLQVANQLDSNKVNKYNISTGRNRLTYYALSCQCWTMLMGGSTQHSS